MKIQGSINYARAAVMAVFFYMIAYYAILVINTIMPMKKVTFVPGISNLIRKHF